MESGRNKRVMCVVGTRPEVVKVAPLVHVLHARSDFDSVLVSTGQHRELLDQMLGVFQLEPDIEMSLMRRNQSPNRVAAEILPRMEDLFESAKPDVVVAQGDTTTVMATALACFHSGVRFAHIEAGLRTGDLRAPYPEEFNRRVVTLATDLHFAPTGLAARNLLAEGVREETVHVTGNTVVDALQSIIARPDALPQCLLPPSPYILMTCHRRETMGAPMEEIFRAVREFAEGHADTTIWYPVHPNPRVQEPAYRLLGNTSNIVLTEPLDYVTFVHAMRGCRLLLTDSGGLQEEGVALHKPVLVLRDRTERPEGVESGAARLVGPHRKRILDALHELQDGSDAYRKMATGSNPYGDGRAAERITAILAGESVPSWETGSPR